MNRKLSNMLIVVAILCLLGLAGMKGSHIAAKKVSGISLAKDTPRNVSITDPTLKKQVKELNRDLKAYDTFSPFGSYEAKSLRIPKKYLNSVMSDNMPDIEGQVSANIPIVYYHELIGRGLNRVLHNKHIAAYRLEDIIDGKYIFISHSADRRLYSLSIDEKTGGSYRSQLTWVQYRAAHGRVYNYDLTGESADTTNVFNNDGFSIIADFHTPEGTKYLLQGYVMECNTCENQHIELVEFKAGRFTEDFGYTLNTRGAYAGNDNRGIGYDEQTRLITVDYTSDDLTHVRSCGDLQNLEDIKRDSAGDDQDDAKNYGKPCHCEFTFNGRTFVLDRKKSNVGN